MKPTLSSLCCHDAKHSDPSLGSLSNGMVFHHLQVTLNKDVGKDEFRLASLCDMLSHLPTTRSSLCPPFPFQYLANLAISQHLKERRQKDTRFSPFISHICILSSLPPQSSIFPLYSFLSLLLIQSQKATT